jgi:hypothetical protein
MSIIGMCLSDLLTIDYQQKIGLLQLILEPYLLKLGELAELRQTDKQSQSMTCHLLNLLSQFMTSLIQRQQNHANNDLISTSINTSQGADSSSFLGNSSASIGVPSPNVLNERAIVNSILIKMMPIYKKIITRNLESDLAIIDKLFESISVILSSNMSTNVNTSGNNSESADFNLILNGLLELLYSVNDEAWRRYTYEVTRQVR